MNKTSAARKAGAGIFDVEDNAPVRRDSAMVSLAEKRYLDDFDKRFKYVRWTYPHTVKNLIGNYGMRILDEIGDLDYEQIVELSRSKIDLVAGAAQALLKDIGKAYKPPREKRKPRKNTKNKYQCPKCKTRCNQIVTAPNPAKKGKTSRKCMICEKVY